MLTEIAGSELRQTVEEFRKRIRSELSSKGKRAFLFPGGGSDDSDKYELLTPYGLMSISIAADKEDRYIHYINLDQEEKVIAYDKSSDLEINIPKDLNRRIATLLVKDQAHRYICHRGKLTVHMGSRKISDVLDHFATKHGNVIQVKEHSKIDSVIRVADINSKTLFEEIALFTHQVKDFKNQFRNV
ncbi:MAG: hypothetical protein ABL884_05155 [Methyloglobulus sp.]